MNNTKQTTIIVNTLISKALLKLQTDTPLVANAIATDHDHQLRVRMCHYYTIEITGPNSLDFTATATEMVRIY